MSVRTYGYMGSMDSGWPTPLSCRQSCPPIPMRPSTASPNVRLRFFKSPRYRVALRRDGEPRTSVIRPGYQLNRAYASPGPLWTSQLSRMCSSRRLLLLGTPGNEWTPKMGRTLCVPPPTNRLDRCLQPRTDPRGRLRGGASMAQPERGLTAGMEASYGDDRASGASVSSQMTAG